MAKGYRSQALAPASSASAQAVASGQTLSIGQRKTALDYMKRCATTWQQAMPGWRFLLQYRDRDYIRQLNLTEKQLVAVREAMQGKPSAQADITVPIIMPQIETSVAYKTGVFLSSYPIFGVVSDPKNIDIATMFESTLAKQAEKFGWARELIKVFRNGDKYNYAPCVVDWTRIPVNTVVSADATKVNPGTKLDSSFYAGNWIRAIDPYNCFHDPLVAPCDLHTNGEFFGWNEVMTRIAFKRFVGRLDQRFTTNIRECYESGYNSMGAGVGASNSAFDYFVPSINRYLNLDSIQRAGVVNWAAWAGLEKSGNNDIDYKDRYLVTPFYCRACPSDFGGHGNTPVVYKMIAVNWQHIIYAERLDVAHDYLPTLIMQPNEDGLGYQTPSKLDNASPYQAMATSMWATTAESQRRKVYDRLLYNAHYIDKKNIDPAASVSRIPVKNAGMLNFNIANAIYKIPYDDPQPTLGIQASQVVSQMADEAAGQNKVSRGQFQKGNKTTTEFETTVDNSNSRQQLEAVTIEHQFMTPVKEIVRANTLQNQGVETILNRESNSEVQIDPIQLRETILEFTLTDGVLPADKILNPQLMQAFLQASPAIPGLATEFDLLGMFLYWCKVKGARWTNDFRRDPAQQQQALNTMRAQSQATSATPTDNTQNAAQAAQAQAAQAQAVQAAQPQQ